MSTFQKSLLLQLLRSRPALLHPGPLLLLGELKLDWIGLDCSIYILLKKMHFREGWDEQGLDWKPSLS
jgi:hypothetical protein